MSQSVNTLRPAPRRPTAGPGARPAPRDAGDPGDSPARERPAGKPYRTVADWRQTGAFVAGLAVGALLGAGAALLTAPQSGIETRLALKRGARRARVRAEDQWDGLGRELRVAARRRKRALRRKLEATRWRAADAFDG